MRLRTHRSLWHSPAIHGPQASLRFLAAILAFIPASVFAAPNTTGAGFSNAAGFEDLVKQGRDAFLASDLDRAEAAYNQACPADVVKTYTVARLVTCENLLASVDEARGNLARAEQRFLHAVATAEQAGLAYRPLYCAKLIDLGEHYHRVGRLADAEATLLKAVEVTRHSGGVGTDLLPEALIRLGALYSDSGTPERGRAPITEALSIVAAPVVDGQPRPSDKEIAYAHGALGMIELARGNRREADANLREAVTLATNALGEDHPVTLAYQTNLALVLIADRQFERAGLLLRRAQYVMEKRGSTAGLQFAVICAEMSDVAGGLGKMAEAENYAERAISILNMQPRPNARTISVAQVTLSAIYIRSHDLASAEKILPQAVEIQRSLAASPSMLAASLHLLGELRAQQHNWAEAESLYREALGIYTKDKGKVNPATAAVLRELADILKHEGGSKDEVRALEGQARDILRASGHSAPHA
jgi:tetratricopeptide (TPR) repeat protein